MCGRGGGMWWEGWRNVVERVSCVEGLPSQQSEKWLNRYKTRTGGIKFRPRKRDYNSLGYIRPFEDGYRMSISYRQWPTSIYLTIMTFSLTLSRK